MLLSFSIPDRASMCEHVPKDVKMEVAHRLQAENLQIYREGRLTKRSCIREGWAFHFINAATPWAMDALELFCWFCSLVTSKNHKSYMCT